ncbi:hypothetical protein Prede_1362 [Prevotella dentalis DSM 3688]|nr:hypothetical protein Prede_1362 [Prevotella dentalis DSM 3688]
MKINKIKRYINVFTDKFRINYVSLYLFTFSILKLTGIIKCSWLFLLLALLF